MCAVFNVELKVISFNRGVLLVVLLFSLLSSIPISRCLSETGDEPATFLDRYAVHDYVLVVRVTGKNVASDKTHYTFNVTADLKTPSMASEVYLTVEGGSEIATHPSPSFIVDVDYVLFFSELDEGFNVLGHDYVYTLLNSVDPSFIEELGLAIKAMEGAGCSGEITGEISTEVPLADDYPGAPVAKKAVEPSNGSYLKPQTPGSADIALGNNWYNTLLLYLPFLCIAAIYATLIPAMRKR